MKNLDRNQLAVMGILTLVSLLVALAAIRSSAGLDGDVHTIVGVDPGHADNMGADFARLVTELAAARQLNADADHSIQRDPLVPYARPEPKPKSKATEPKPKVAQVPSYEVVAVVIDANPRAIMRIGTDTVVVKVGDELGGKEVVGISYDGVTVEGGKKYPYPSR
jgi:hypothetical protein